MAQAARPFTREQRWRGSGSAASAAARADSPTHRTGQAGDCGPAYAERGPDRRAASSPFARFRAR
ncbi:hypothetical protein GCM10019016_129590 [Streptomyces prasinosporus]|uniref:Uncharacterized protein n=1 Tax=Streptomyces prasinosporus TaxID=68256 RepID=A0ABP6UF66_9ACTN|nr:hypothetical protein GCM10010332_67990 [Streptomyces albogriseolus]